MNNDELAHHGTKGMKWGVWNAETAARYAGIIGGAIKKQSRKIANNVSEKHQERKYQREQIKAIEKQQREAKKNEAIERKQFDKETRKKYHLSAKKYNQLRKQTLDSNDPNVVKKGMHLLTDDELVKKIDRLKKENEIYNLAHLQKKNEADRKKAINEARQKTLSYNIANKVADQAIGVAKDKILSPAADDLYKQAKKQVQKAQQDAREREAKAKAEAEEKLQKKKEKEEKAYQERKEIASKQTESTKELIEKANREIENANIEREQKRKEKIVEGSERVTEILRNNPSNAIVKYDESKATDQFRRENWYKLARKRLL